MLRSPGYEAFSTLPTESYPLKSIKIFREAFYMSFLFFMLSSGVLPSLMEVSVPLANPYARSSHT
ncbi:hypothetical protein SAMN02746026_00126 [Pseudomonas sp. LAIL14HWK12:I4]|nr:hypothetical protein F473_00414 [Pseudomonas sp. URIL14HWK12:I1]SNB56396.1 hypothetical protein SAMN02746026_00126 [Pseudomonas sp. LAIL14HWK12:I4]